MKHTPVTPEFRQLRQRDLKFWAILGYTVTYKTLAHQNKIKMEKGRKEEKMSVPEILTAIHS